LKKSGFWQKFAEIWSGDAALQKREREYLALQNKVLQTKLDLKGLKAQKKTATALYERAHCKIERIERKIIKQPDTDCQVSLTEAKKTFEKCKQELSKLEIRDTELKANLAIAEDKIQNQKIKRRALAAISEAKSSVELTRAFSVGLKQEAMDSNFKTMEQSVAKLEEQNTKVLHELLLNYADGKIEKMDEQALKLASAVIEDAIKTLTDGGAQLNFEYIKIKEQINTWSERKRIAEEHGNLALAHQAHLRALAWMDTSIEQSIECDKLANACDELSQLRDRVLKVAAKIESERLDATDCSPST